MAEIPTKLPPGTLKWYAEVKEKATGKPYTYYINGSFDSIQQLAEHITRYFPHVEVLHCDRVTVQPTRMLVPIPPHHFEHGFTAQALGLKGPTPGTIKSGKKATTQQPSKGISLRPILMKPLY